MKSRTEQNRSGHNFMWVIKRLVPLTLILVSSCTPLRIQLPLEIDAADWQMDGRTTDRRQESIDQPLVLPLQEAWLYNATAGFPDGSPLIVGSTVIVGTRKGEIHAVNLQDGERVGTQEFGRSIEGSAALSHQVLFVPNSWGKRALEAFDLKSGSRKWDYRGVPIESSVLPVGDLVIVGDVEGNVLAMDQETGLIRWVYEFGDYASVLSDPAAVDDERVAVADETGRIALLRASDGEELWSKSLGYPVESGLSSAFNVVFVPTTRGRFLAIDADDGSVIWEFSVPNNEIRFTSPAISDSQVIFGGSDGVLRSLDLRSGLPGWTFQTDGTIAASPVINGDLVFVGAMDKKIYGIHRQNGSVQWETTLRGRVKSAPAVRDGYLIVMSEPRYVYAFTNATNIRD